MTDLFKHIETLRIDGGVAGDVTGVSYDSRRVLPGHVFVAVPGQRTDGNSFVEAALDRGAVAVVETVDRKPFRRETHVTVANARRALAGLSAAYHGFPDQSLKMIGITGTNGKTTTAFMVKHLLESCGIRSGLLGTVRYEVGDRVIPAARTTPEAPEIHEMLATMKQAGCGACVMEVSSHALAQDRVHGLDFDVAAFTNLTQDHLDYHKSMEDYFAAKALLFQSLGRKEKTAVAVLNTDDDSGLVLMEKIPMQARKVSYGIDTPASLRARILSLEGRGCRFVLVQAGQEQEVTLPMTGRHNVSNALCALGIGLSLGLDTAGMIAALATLRGVPGRLEAVAHRLPFDVFVDYAHTDDALRNVLRTVREFARGRVILVFGCGGSRDAKKRPLMGRVASELADFSVLTSDNPRKENPADILRQISAGFGGAEKHAVIEDRREAIFRALSMARENDIVLVAGKGHETYQEFADAIVPFDDREVVAECLTQIAESRPWKQ
ncbi:MAG: UDP-N-acetylmuramoyl-L-alanyl-D-glutamate--2,6-diaminopimelate ligase [Verrucomicrobiae bacterium]|nr:UDP-N-acetylmuramoyl-L-alanyl-D-glutamate--2,6-diaminopimelate ligase [Verrucomicrobiae bacterium]